MRIKNQEDFWAGAMFIGFGIITLVASRDYPMGSAFRMGPGYFPTYLAVLIVIIGAALAGKSLSTPGERVGPWGWRPLVCLSAAFAGFGLLIDRAGFVASLLVLIVASSFAGRDTRPVELVMLVIVLISGSVALFVYGLELPYRLFPWN